MGKMEQMLKSEITRLARKQMRATCLPLARDVRRLSALRSHPRIDFSGRTGGQRFSRGALRPPRRHAQSSIRSLI
jgi:hypothetical protein